MKKLNEGLAFFIELAMVAAYAYFGFTYFEGAVLKWLLGLGIPVILVALWGILLAPRSQRRLKIVPGVALSSALFILASVLLIVDRQMALGIILLVMSMTNRFLALKWKQW